MDDPDRAGKKKRTLKRDDLVYPELSYKIIGALFDVYNELGPGLLEKMYQRAVAKALTDRHLAFEEQVPYGLEYKGEKIGQQFLDFLIENKVVLELKQGDRFRKQNLDQIIAYLKSTEKHLALLANFSRDGVLFRRLVNITS